LIASEGATSAEVVQVACQFPPTRATDWDPQLVIVVPAAVNATFPEGVTGVNVAPPSCAVNVTEAFTFEADVPVLDVSVNVAGSAVTVWVSVAAEATVKLGSPE
jgi:hypothetical protein